MQLRKSQFLKAFFVILFLFEFLSPAFPTHPELYSKDIHYEVNRPNHLNILINLFSEQLNENEEGREDFKSTLLFCANSVVYSPCRAYPLSSDRLSNTDKTCHPYPYSALFTMYCEYLI